MYLERVGMSSPCQWGTRIAVPNSRTVEELLMSAAKGSRSSGRPAWGAGWLEALLDLDCDDPIPIQRNQPAVLDAVQH